MTMLHLMNAIEINVQLLPGMKDEAVKPITKRLKIGTCDEILATDDRFKRNCNRIHS